MIERRFEALAESGPPTSGCDSGRRGIEIVHVKRHDGSKAHACLTYAGHRQCPLAHIVPRISGSRAPAFALRGSRAAAIGIAFAVSG